MERSEVGELEVCGNFDVTCVTCTWYRMAPFDQMWGMKVYLVEGGIV